jgi:selenocysteine-specific elongation factor
MGRAIVGTAGHIDHGKTSLVLALTGIDCDRWAEEKARGITIDLGFAHLEEGDLQIGFIDVPGHERFLHNALAGLGGIRVMLLVVAADEGVKPQTREHLAVCSLLGIPAGIVALTKADLVAEDLLELAQLEVEDLLAGTPFEGSAILPVSSTTGQGIPELKAALIDLASRHAVSSDVTGPERPARLPIDRAFHLRGLGVVVTGTLASGEIRPGDTLEVLPRGQRARVRSIQVHGQPRETAEAGERTSLQLGGVALEELGRGMQLGPPDAFAASTSLLARFTLLPDAPAPLRGFTPVRLHLFASEVLGRVRPLAPPSEAGLMPGETGLVEIRLEAPVTAVRGDRYILRRPSPAATLGGGEVLDPRWRRHRGTILVQALAALQGDPRPALAFWVQEAGERGAAAAELARRLGLPPARVEAELKKLVAANKLIEVPAQEKRFLAPSAIQRVTERARRILKEYFQKDRLADGMPKAEAVKRILRGRAAELAPMYLGWLEAQKVLVVQGDQVTLPGRSAQLTGEESTLATAVVERFDRGGLTPPSPSELSIALNAKPQILEGVIRHMVSRGQLIRLPDGLILAASAVAGLKRDLLATGWERFTVPEFKDRFGLSRKWAIPLLEHLDSKGVTRRVGDERQVVRPAERKLA